MEPDGEKILQFGHVNDPVKKRIRRPGPERLPTKIGSGRVIRDSEMASGIALTTFFGIRDVP